MPPAPPARRAAACRALAVLAAVSLAASAEPPAVRVHASVSRRFAAHGPDSAQNMDILLRIETLAARMESLTGRPLPAHPIAPLRVHFVEDPGSEPGVLYRETVAGGRIHQGLWISHPGRTDPRRWMETAAFLLSSRYAREQTPPRGERLPVDRVPDWFAAGLAGYLEPGDRRAAYALAGEATADGRLPGWREVLDWRASDAPDELERAACVALFGWIAARPDTRNRLLRLFARFGEGPATAADIGAELMDEGTPDREAELHWRLWALSLETRMPGAFRDPDAVRRDLRDRLALPAVLFTTDGPEPIPDPVTPRSLLDGRGADWVRPAARRMQASLSRVPPAALPGEIRPLPGLWFRWLAAVAEPEPGPLGRRLGRGAPRERLRRELEALERMLSDPPGEPGPREPGPEGDAPGAAGPEPPPEGPPFSFGRGTGGRYTPA